MLTIGYLTCDLTATFHNINAANMTNFNRDVPPKVEHVWENRCMYYICPQKWCRNVINNKILYHALLNFDGLNNHNDDLSASGGPNMM